MKVGDDIRLHVVLRALEEEATDDTLDLIVDRVNDILDEIGFFRRVEMDWEEAIKAGLVEDETDDIPF